MAVIENLRFNLCFECFRHSSLFQLCELAIVYHITVKYFNSVLCLTALNAVINHPLLKGNRYL